MARKETCNLEIEKTVYPGSTPAPNSRVQIVLHLTIDGEKFEPAVAVDFDKEGKPERVRLALVVDGKKFEPVSVFFELDEAGNLVVAKLWPNDPRVVDDSAS